MINPVPWVTRPHRRSRRPKRWMRRIPPRDRAVAQPSRSRTTSRYVIVAVAAATLVSTLAPTIASAQDRTRLNHLERLMDVAKARSSGARHARSMQRDRINIDLADHKKI